MRRLSLAISLLFFLSGCSFLGYESLDDMAEQAAKNDKQSLEIKQLRLHYESGETYYRNGEIDLAEEQFLEILSIRASEESALYRLGTISFKRGEFSKSAEYFERTIKVNPRNEKAHYNLAAIRLMQAENHFKYYASLVGKDTDLAKVTELLGGIDSFTSEDNNSDKSHSLDQIAGALKK